MNLNRTLESSLSPYAGVNHILQVSSENPEKNKNEIKDLSKIISETQLTGSKKIIATPLESVGAPEEAYKEALGGVEPKFNELEQSIPHDIQARESLISDLEALNEEWGAFTNELEIYDYTIPLFTWEPVVNSDTAASKMISREQFDGLISKLKSMQKIKEKGLINEAEKYMEELESKIKVYGPALTPEELNRISKRLEGSLSDTAILNQIEKSKIKEEGLKQIHQNYKALIDGLIKSYEKAVLIISRLEAFVEIYASSKKIKQVKATIKEMHEAMDRIHTDKIASILPENGKTDKKIEFGLHQKYKNGTQIQLQQCMQVHSDIAELNALKEQIRWTVNENNQHLTQQIFKLSGIEGNKSTSENFNKNIQYLVKTVSLRDRFVLLWNDLCLELYKANLDLKIFLDFINVVANQTDLFLQCATIMQEMRFNRLNANERDTHFNMFNVQSKAYEVLCERIRSKAIHPFYQENDHPLPTYPFDPLKTNLALYISGLHLQETIDALDNPIVKIEELGLIVNADFMREKIVDKVKELNRSKATEVLGLKKRVEIAFSHILPNIFKLAAGELNTTSKALEETNSKEMEHLDLCFTRAYDYENFVGKAMHRVGKAIFTSASNVLVRWNAENTQTMRNQHIHKKILSPFI